MKQIITVIGNVGVGKTTVLPVIAEALDADIIRADELFQKNPFRDLFLHDISRWGLTNELWLLHKRTQYIQEALNQSRHQTVVIDSGVLMSWVYTKSHVLSGKMTEKEWLFFHELFTEWSWFLTKSTLIYLTAPITTLLERIQKRGRDYELTTYTKEYLQDLEHGLDAFCKTFSESNIVPFSYEEIGDIQSEVDKNIFMHLLKQRFHR